MPFTVLTTAALVAELLLLLAGLFLVWKRLLQPALRGAAPELRVSPWDCSLLDLGLLLWMVLCCGFTLQLAGAGVLASFELAQAPLQVATGICFGLGMLSGILLFRHFNAAGRRLDTPRLPFVREGALTLVLALPLVFATGLLWHAMLGALGIPVEQQELIHLFRTLRDWPVLSAMIVMAVVVAPVTEELLFRAGIFRFMRSRTPRWVALLVPALLFGLLHFNLASFPQLVVLGLLLALAYERTGNIAVPMLAHALFNLNTVLLLLADVKI